MRASAGPLYGTTCTLPIGVRDSGGHILHFLLLHMGTQHLCTRLNIARQQCGATRKRVQLEHQSWFAMLRWYRNSVSACALTTGW